MTPAQTDPSAPAPSAVDDRLIDRRSGEGAVRRAAQLVLNRSTEGGEKQVRRRSRRGRTTPILVGNGLQFHYAVGALLVVALLASAFRDRIWKMMPHPAPVVQGALKPGVGTVPPAPRFHMPSWFHIEIPFILIGFLVWLYLTPGVWDRVALAIGLRKDKERRSRKRHG